VTLRAVRRADWLFAPGGAKVCGRGLVFFGVGSLASKVPVTGGTVEILHSAVEAFRRREVNYRDILEDLPAAIYTTDAEGRITYFNQACIAFSGRTPTLGTDQWCVTWKLFTPDGQRMAHDACPMAVALREGRPVRGMEAVAERPDGSRIAFVPYPTPIHDATGGLIGAVNMLVDITEQKKSEQRMTLMAREVDHRANNLLAVTQSLVQVTQAETVEEYKRVLEGRLLALAKVNALIARGRWESVDLRVLVDDELRPFAANTAIDGEPIAIGPNAGQCFAMLVHELATNALKYGALSVAEGTVAISWARDGDETLLFRWAEQGGPAAKEPAKVGTGSSVIRGSVRQLGGEVFREWAPTGLVCTFLCKLADLRQ
jgi:PAS domain S-box-containing protein